MSLHLEADNWLQCAMCVCVFFCTGIGCAFILSEVSVIVCPGVGWLLSHS